MVLRGIPMSQIDLQKLTKKTKSLSISLPNNLSKMVKQTLKSRPSLRKSFLKSLKSKPKERLHVPSTGLQLTGLTVSQSRNSTKKSIQKKMMIQNS